MGIFSMTRFHHVGHKLPRSSPACTLLPWDLFLKDSGGEMPFTILYKLAKFLHGVIIHVLSVVCGGSPYVLVFTEWRENELFPYS